MQSFCLEGACHLGVGWGVVKEVGVEKPGCVCVPVCVFSPGCVLFLHCAPFWKVQEEQPFIWPNSLFSPRLNSLPLPLRL